jgi:hypothetical protein
MTNQLIISKGMAIVTPSGLRCQALRPKQPDQVCNKLIVKKNSLGQIAGSFKCERCSQEIEIQLKPVSTK